MATYSIRFRSTVIPKVPLPFPATPFIIANPNSLISAIISSRSMSKRVPLNYILLVLITVPIGGLTYQSLSTIKVCQSSSPNWYAMFDFRRSGKVFKTQMIVKHHNYLCKYFTKNKIQKYKTNKSTKRFYFSFKKKCKYTPLFSTLFFFIKSLKLLSKTSVEGEGKYFKISQNIYFVLAFYQKYLDNQSDALKVFRDTLLDH